MGISADLIEHFDSIFMLVLRHHTKDENEFLDLVASFLHRKTSFFITTSSWPMTLMEIFQKYGKHKQIIFNYTKLAEKEWKEKENELKEQFGEKRKHIVEVSDDETPAKITKVITMLNPQPVLQCNAQLLPNNNFKVMQQQTPQNQLTTQLTPSSNVIINLNRSPAPSTQTKPPQTVAVKVIPERDYQLAYDRFMTWKQKRPMSENLLMEYFQQMARQYKPSAIWTMYKIFKEMLTANSHISHPNPICLDKIEKFARNPKGYNPIASCFTQDQMKEFLTKAPDYQYLLMKVAMIIGVFGGCEPLALWQLKLGDVIELPNDRYQVTISSYDGNDKRKVTGKRLLIISNLYYPFVHKYIDLRPMAAPEDRFFVGYNCGICTNRLLDIYNISALPNQVAIFLNLHNPTSYTCNSFRDTYRANNLCSPKSIKSPQKNNGPNETERTEEIQDVGMKDGQIDVIDLDADSDYEQEQIQSEVCIKEEVFPCMDDIEFFKEEEPEEFTCEEEGVTCS